MGMRHISLCIGLLTLRGGAGCEALFGENQQRVVAAA